MSIFTPADRRFAQAVSRLVYCNPFLPERIEHERAALGQDFIGADTVWSIKEQNDGARPSLVLLEQRCETIAQAVRERLTRTTSDVPEEDWRLYEDIVWYLFYQRCRESMNQLIAAAGTPAATRAPQYRSFAADYANFFVIPGREFHPWIEPTHAFACFFQIRRAFSLIFNHIVGASAAAARLRAAAWQSVFTRDLPRYVRGLHTQMGDFATLIVGETGTGKEVVARAIGLSRYVPFDPKTQTFTEDFTRLFLPLNLSALSPTLIESELFGHRRGAITGAMENRTGWLETSPAQGSVFLDEVGEICPEIQVKLLRVLQSRVFERIGETQQRKFLGKLLAATNRDLAAEMHAGRFREDFYYRLCSDVIQAPPLRETLRESPQELGNLLLFICRRVCPEPDGEKLAEEIRGWIEANLGPDYPWPGNFRELEQCVRNVLVRGEYRPTRPRPQDDPFMQSVRDGSLTIDQLTQGYVRRVHATTGSYERTAKRVGLDWRTVKAKVEKAE